MDFLMDTWRASRDKLKNELADIAGKKGDPDTATKKVIAHLHSRIAELDALIGAKRDERDA